MNGSFARRLLALVLCLLVPVLAGCGRSSLVDGGSSWRLPWTERPDEVPGVVPPHERIAVLRQLAKEAPSARRESISRRLAEEIRTESDPLVRVQIVYALAECRTETAGSVLRAALKDSESDVRVAACEAWGKRAGNEAMIVLGQVISSDVDDHVRLAATRALGQTGDPAAVAQLAVALEDQDPAMQYRAVLSLQKVTKRDLGNDVNRWRQYVKGELPEPTEPVSIAEQLRRLF